MLRVCDGQGYGRLTHEVNVSHRTTVNPTRSKRRIKPFDVRRVLAERGELSVQQLAAELQVTERQVRIALRCVNYRASVEMTGARGRPRVLYALDGGAA